VARLEAVVAGAENEGSTCKANPDPTKIIKPYAILS